MPLNIKRLEALERKLLTRIPIVELVFVDEGENEDLALAEAKLKNPEADEFTLVVFMASKCDK